MMYSYWQQRHSQTQRVVSAVYPVIDCFLPRCCGLSLLQPSFLPNHPQSIFRTHRSYHNRTHYIFGARNSISPYLSLAIQYIAQLHSFFLISHISLTAQCHKTAQPEGRRWRGIFFASRSGLRQRTNRNNLYSLNPGDISRWAIRPWLKQVRTVR